MVSNNLSPVINAANNIKNQTILLLLILAIVSLFSMDVPFASAAQMLLAVGYALLAEWSFFGGVNASSIQSTIISGLIIGMLLVPGAPAVVLFTAVVLAIGFKRIIRLAPSKHIFNPATTGLVAVTFIFGNYINWWGYSSSVIVIVGGSIILYRMRRISLPIAYVVSRAICALVFGGLALGVNAFELPNLFFAFIMLVEPKTSPTKRNGQYICGALCGILATLSFKFFPTYDGDLIALLLINLLGLFFSKIKKI